MDLQQIIKYRRQSFSVNIRKEQKYKIIKNHRQNLNEQPQQQKQQFTYSGIIDKLENKISFLQGAQIIVQQFHCLDSQGLWHIYFNHPTIFYNLLRTDFWPSEAKQMKVVVQAICILIDGYSDMVQHYVKGGITGTMQQIMRRVGDEQCLYLMSIVVYNGNQNIFKFLIQRYSFITSNQSNHIWQHLSSHLQIPSTLSHKAFYILAHTFSNCNYNQTLFLINNYNILELIAQALSLFTDSQILIYCLLSLECIFYYGNFEQEQQRCIKSKGNWATQFIIKKGYSKNLQNLLQHSNKQVYQKCVKLIEGYYNFQQG